MNSNLNKIDIGFRFFLGLSIIAVVLAMPAVPAWLALVATYPMFTGVLSWDPIYAVYLTLAKTGDSKRFANAETLGATA